MLIILLTFDFYSAIFSLKGIDIDYVSQKISKSIHVFPTPDLLQNHLLK